MALQGRVIQQGDAGSEGCFTDVRVLVIEMTGDGREEQRADRADSDERKVILGRETDAAHRLLGLVADRVGH